MITRNPVSHLREVGFCVFLKSINDKMVKGCLQCQHLYPEWIS